MSVAGDARRARLLRRLAQVHGLVEALMEEVEAWRGEEPDFVTEFDAARLETELKVAAVVIGNATEKTQQVGRWEDIKARGWATVKKEIR